MSSSSHRLHLPNGSVDLVSGVITREGEDSGKLTSTEMHLLSYFVANPGRAVPRDELHEKVWGYSPRVVTRAVDLAVLRVRAKLGDDAEEKFVIATERGVGYRFLLQQPVEASRRFEPATSFVGRRGELSALEGLLTKQRMVTLLGPPGMGKTRLAKQYALDPEQQYREIWFVDLTVVASPELVKVALCQAMGVGQDYLSELETLLAEAGESLLIMDNFETVLSAAPLVGQWLARAPSLRVLVTSRERLRISAEHCLRLDQLPRPEAVQLFLERSRAVGAPNNEDGGTIEELVLRLDGNPLAIELAASRRSALSPKDILTQLSNRFRLLQTHPRDGARDSLRAAVESSWDALEAAEARTMALCSVFHNGFSVALAEVVVGLGDDEPWIVDVLESLVDKSLLYTKKVAELGELRFHFFEYIRDFAAEKLGELGLRAEAAARHSEALLARFNSDWNQQKAVSVKAHLDDLVAIHERGLKIGDHRAVVQAVLIGKYYFLPVTHEYRQLWVAAEDSARKLGLAEQVEVLTHRARVSAYTAKLDEAEADALSAAKLAEKLGDGKTMARALRVACLARTDLGKETIPLLERALSVATVDPTVEWEVRCDLAVARSAVDPKAALADAEDAWRSAVGRSEKVSASWAMGIALLFQGSEECLGWFVQLADMAQKIPIFESTVASATGIAHMRFGREGEALTCFSRALECTE
ncbi:MAG: AAA family ATPase, partial [Proteobacteria bacterium]|nr:AAA family ATPase [Pseudomonadota bacterium]